IASMSGWKFRRAMFVVAWSLASLMFLHAQDNPIRREADANGPEARPPGPGEPNFGGPPPFARGGFGGRGGPGGFPGMGQKTSLVKKFDQDGDGRLNAAESKAARESLQKERAQGGGRRSCGGPGG